MAKDIQFGTDGWRDRMYHKFNEENVIRVVRAIAAYTKQENGQDRVLLSVMMPGSFLITLRGSRKGSFCRWYTGLYLAAGFTYPVVAYAVSQLNAFGAVMFTASHNPPEYNGIKFIPYYAGPATPEITAAIEALIPEESNPLPPINKEKVMLYDPLTIILRT